MGYWIAKYNMFDENARDVCTVFFDDNSRSWGFKDLYGHSEFGFVTEEDAIEYCNDYMYYTYGIL